MPASRPPWTRPEQSPKQLTAYWRRQTQPQAFQQVSTYRPRMSSNYLVIKSHVNLAERKRASQDALRLRNGGTDTALAHSLHLAPDELGFDIHRMTSTKAFRI